MPAQIASPTHAVGVRTTTVWVSPDVPRPLDAPMLGASPSPRAWADGQDKQARLGLDGVADTQLLLGEPVGVLEEVGEWARVVAPWQPSSKDRRGYPGWVPRSHLTDLPEASAEEAVVVATTTVLRATPGGAPLLDGVSYATILPVASSGPEGVRVHLPGGSDAWLDPAACDVRAAGFDHSVTASTVLAGARRFLGLQYLWSGMSAFGLDCSGLVHIAFRASGRVVPRDAMDQAVVSSDVPLGKLEAGDLMFFGQADKGITHVGFATEVSGDLLHAPRTGSAVEEVPLPDDRKATLTSAGRLTD